jgi:hypothetical protein
MDGQTYATASLYNPHTLTNDERLAIINRRLQIDEEMRNQRLVVQTMEIDNLFRLYQTIRVTTINPTPWTKFKIFGTKLKLVLTATWKSDPIGVIVITLLTTIITFIGIMELFGA